MNQPLTIIRKYFTILFLCLASLISQAQKNQELTSPAQSVFIEIGGNGVLVSANYDVRFTAHQNGIGGRIGAGFLGGSGGGILTIPVGLNYLAGKAPNFLEVGVGYTYLTITGSDNFLSGSGSLFFPSVGYRYQQIGNGLMARIIISPAIALNNGGGWIFFGGIGVGYKF